MPKHSSFWQLIDDMARASGPITHEQWTNDAHAIAAFMTAAGHKITAEDVASELRRFVPARCRWRVRTPGPRRLPLHATFTIRPMTRGEDGELRTRGLLGRLPALAGFMHGGGPWQPWLTRSDRTCLARRGQANVARADTRQTPISIECSTSPFSPPRSRASAAESTYAGIVRLIETSEESKAPFVRLADRYALGFLALALALRLRLGGRG